MSVHEMLMKPLKRLFDDSEYIQKPNLPEREVTLVAVSNQAGEAERKLKEFGIGIISVKPDQRLPLPINSHADIQLLHAENNTVFCHCEHLFAGEFVEKFDIKSIKEKTGNTYPQDVFLNCTILNDKIICNPKTIAPEILEFAYSRNLTVIPVKQGYSKCSICVVNKSAIITDDESIFTAAGNFLNDVLLVLKGSIGLKGYNYGFIGGCCGKISNNKIAFNGRLDSHSDCNRIIDFLEKHSVEPIELTNDKLIDIGGILPLMQLKD